MIKNLNVEVCILNNNNCGLCDFQKGIIERNCILFDEKLHCKPNDYPIFLKCDKCKK